MGKPVAVTSLMFLLMHAFDIRTIENISDYFI